jgi:hypothetical protein
MAGVKLPDMRPWGRRPLTIPPDSRAAWVELAIWELWMGALVAIAGGFGAVFITLAPTRIVTMINLDACYAPPPVAIPCDRVVYVGGALDAAFTALWGVMMVGVAGWFLCELWLAVEPKPITDDFLRLLNDSFGRDWRNPLKWPWGRVLYAYAFTTAGAIVVAALAMSLWTVVGSSAPPKPLRPRVNTSQGFRFER